MTQFDAHPAVQALAFDVFGTVVDWRGSIARLNTYVDTIFASGCTPMSSLTSVQMTQNHTGLPVVSSSSFSTSFMMPGKSGLKTRSPGSTYCFPLSTEQSGPAP